MRGADINCCITSPPYWGLRDYGHGQQIGMEDNPHAYIDALMGVFEPLYDVMSDDGVLWVVIGDTFINFKAGSGCRAQTLAKKKSRWEPGDGVCANRNSRFLKRLGFKDKTQTGIPAMFARAMDDRKWRLRQTIIWRKNNPMPESVKDRCTRSHEFIFFFTKQSHGYLNSFKELQTESVDYLYAWPRDVWTIGVEGYKGHKAVFPRELVRRCLAASGKGRTVIDPFCGTGTVAEMGLKLGWTPVMLESNEEFLPLIKERMALGFDVSTRNAAFSPA